MSINRVKIHNLSTRSTLAFGLLLSFSMCFTGCQFAPKSSANIWPWKKDTIASTPDRILPVWTDSILHQTNQPGVRGFGGRIYFYGKEGTDPVQVDGNLAVYVFDADDSAPTDQKPLRKYIFPAEQFQSHMSKTSIGPSYSVWLPWGEVGGPPKRLSLIARFEGREGGTTISDPTIKMLPGIPQNKEGVDNDSIATKTNTAPISLAGHVRSATVSKKKEDSTSESDVDTIDLPPSFQRHLRAPAPGADSASRIQPGDGNARPTGTDSSPAGKASTEELSSVSGNSSDEAQQVAAGPVSTQVYDYRTRGRQRDTFNNRLTKTDIREGRWIKSVSRTEKPERQSDSH